VEDRTTAKVVAFFERLKGWGLNFHAFYIDGCKAYKEAIPLVYPEAVIQYDYFHIIQNIFRHLWRATVSHRKEIKAEVKETNDVELSVWLEELADRLLTNRGLLFKNDERMSVEERRTLRELLADDLDMRKLRGFILKVWGIFRESKGERGARQRLANLRKRPEVEGNNAFGKVVKFLESRFEDMTAFLRRDRIKRNSLAESGIRSLRRLERGHDGFRGTAGRDKYLRLYQAIRYCGWSVHRGDGLLDLPTLMKA
jgi:transposase